jgi:murein DD-endopeptidase MepM/ murein hydrolase activator NlpD
VTRVRPLVAIALLAALLAGGPARATSPLENQLGDVSARIDDLTAQVDAAAASRPALVTDLVEARDRLASEVDDLASIQLQLDEVEADHAAARSDLDRLQADLEAAYDRLAVVRTDLGDAQEAARVWARELYMGSGQVTLGVAFGAAEMTEMLVGLEYLHAVAADGDRALLRYESLQVEEERERDRIAEQEQEVAGAVADLEASQAALTGLHADQEEAVATVESEVATLRGRLDALDEEIADFEGELAGLAEEQERLEALIAQETSDDGTAPSVLVRPVPGWITSSFGPRLHPILGTTRMHTGVDMHAAWGEPVAAAAGGRVIFAGAYGGYGNAVILDHGGGMSTLYGHLSSIVVGYGDTVTAGQTIGLVGATGLATGPHLHFEVRIDGQPVDPAPYL